MLGAKSSASAGNGAEIGQKGREMGEEKHAFCEHSQESEGFSHPSLEHSYRVIFISTTQGGTGWTF